MLAAAGLRQEPHCKEVLLLVTAKRVKNRASERHKAVLTDSADQRSLAWLSAWRRYQPKELIVTENGFSVKGEETKPLAEVLNDTERVIFYRGYVDAAIDAVEQDQVLHHSSEDCLEEHRLAGI